jgi:Mg/Co/Ni transporter MgtE
MDPRNALRLLREWILLGRWGQVAEQLDLLHVDAIGRALIGLDQARLIRTFNLLPATRRPAVFARLAAQEQAVLLESLGRQGVRRIVRGLLPEHRHALLRSHPLERHLRTSLA